MADKKKDAPAPPEFGPYFFPAILAVMGLWCLWDGWFTTAADMAEHQTFNRVAAVILLVWAAIDVYRMQRAEKISAKETESTKDRTENAT